MPTLILQSQKYGVSESRPAKYPGIRIFRCILLPFSLSLSKCSREMCPLHKCMIFPSFMYTDHFLIFWLPYPFLFFSLFTICRLVSVPPPPFSWFSVTGAKCGRITRIYCPVLNFFSSFYIALVSLKEFHFFFLLILDLNIPFSFPRTCIYAISISTIQLECSYVIYL